MSTWSSRSSWCLINIVILCRLVCGQCTIPYHHRGHWFDIEEGGDAGLFVTEHSWSDMSCVEINVYNTTSSRDGHNVTMLLKKSGSASDCYVCVDALWRTDNIIQYKKSDCFKGLSSFEYMCRSIRHGLPAADQLTTLFRQTIMSINCGSTLGGVFQFSYEDTFSKSGVCNNPNSTITACQPPGSPYIDNETFLVNYLKCPVDTSVNKIQRYQCMGSWFAMVGNKGYTFAAIADTMEKDRRVKFRCLLTDREQKSPDHTTRWTMSRYADCSQLTSNGPIRLALLWDRQKTTELCQ